MPASSVSSHRGRSDMGWLLDLLRDEDERARALLRWRDAEDLHQVSSYTERGRYPLLFEACRAEAAARFDPDRLRILSFGCSTGEELLTLRSHFPKARIVGSDINPRNVRIARSRIRDGGIEVLDAGVAPRGPFDLVFCLAVLQRSETRHRARHDVEAVYPFARFDAALAELDAVLAVGGLLAIQYSTYRFEDASVAPRYERTSFPGEPDEGARLDPRGKPIARDRDGGEIWLKRAAAAERPARPHAPRDDAASDPLTRLEAAALLALGELVVERVRFKHLARLLGRARVERTTALGEGDAARVARVRSAVQSMARRVPFRPGAMAQAIAAQLMLRLRDVPSTFYVGVRRRERGVESHAWVEAGGVTVVGGSGDAYVPMQWFSA